MKKQKNKKTNPFKNGYYLFRKIKRVWKKTFSDT